MQVSSITLNSTQRVHTSAKAAQSCNITVFWSASGSKSAPEYTVNSNHSDWLMEAMIFGVYLNAVQEYLGFVQEQTVKEFK